MLDVKPIGGSLNSNKEAWIFLAVHDTGSQYKDTKKMLWKDINGDDDVELLKKHFDLIIVATRIDGKINAGTYFYLPHDPSKEERHDDSTEFHNFLNRIYDTSRTVSMQYIREM